MDPVSCYPLRGQATFLVQKEIRAGVFVVYAGSNIEDDLTADYYQRASG